MTKSKGKAKKANAPAKAKTKAPDREASSADVPAPATYLLGFLALAVSIMASGTLVARHLFGITIPGCGPESNCARAAASVWGSVPGLGWPVSIVGLAWFITALVLWIRAQEGASLALKNLARLGAALSLMFVAAMIIGGYVCNYCVTAHAANLVFWLAVELRPRKNAPSMPTLVQAAIAMIAAGGVLLATEALVVKKTIEKAEDDLTTSIENIIAHDPDEEVLTLDPDYAFTGRYRRGPEEAAIRIVIYSDYQCPDCQRIEGQVRQVLRERDDVSFSAKHFPFSNVCNPHMGQANPHPNACWAARAAETAGILHGEEGFWRMHEWLFDRGGEFTDSEFNDALRNVFRWDPQPFTQMMLSQRTEDLVKADIEEGVDLGIHFTPMIFVNAVELKGYMAANAVIKMVDQVAAANPEPRTAKVDRPPSAFGKYLQDWREARVRDLRGSQPPWRRGPENAATRFVLSGDYTSSVTRAAHERILELYKGRDDVSYSFRHYPMDPACNRFYQQTARAGARLKARAAEAAGALGGNDAFWAMHDWLMANQDASGADALVAAAGQQGLDPGAFRNALNGPESSAAVADDVNTVSRLRFLPTVFVNEKAMPRWKMRDRDLLGPIVAENAAN